MRLPCLAHELTKASFLAPPAAAAAAAAPKNSPGNAEPSATDVRTLFVHLARFPFSCVAAALPPLEEWRPEHVEQWRLSLPEDDRANFKEFFENLPRGVKGSTLASYDKSDVEKRFKTDDGRAFAPEVHARLQKFKGQRAPRFLAIRILTLAQPTLARDCPYKCLLQLLQVPLLFYGFIFVPCSGANCASIRND